MAATHVFIGPIRTGLEILTPQERLVALEIARGLSNKEIASVLGKSEGTVKNQVRACLAKFEEPSRCLLIARLWRDRIVS